MQKEISLKETEEKVLDVYQRVNPSWRSIEKNKELYDVMRTWREELFFHRLKLPRRLFKDATVLSLGSGTGEYEVFYPEWGCSEYTCIEMNEISMQRLHHLFNYYSHKEVLRESYTSSYFDVDLGENRYDFVISDGTFVHTDDPIGALKKYIPKVADDGFFVLGQGELAGTIQRHLQRYILYILAGDDEARIVDYSRRLFKEHLQRSVQIGKRSEEMIIYDTYINPKIKTPSFGELLDAFTEGGMHLYSVYPSVNPFALTNSFREPLTNMEQHEFHHLFLPSQIAWLLAENDDDAVAKNNFGSWRKAAEHFDAFTQCFNDVAPDNANLATLEKALAELSLLQEVGLDKAFKQFYGNRLADFHRDLSSLYDDLNEKNIDALGEKNFLQLFKGTNGVGHMYLVGCRF